MAELMLPAAQEKARTSPAPLKSLAWPTPPTDTDHDFYKPPAHPTYQVADSMPVNITLPPLSTVGTHPAADDAPIQSPPASPSVPWSAKLAPMQSPPQASARTLLPGPRDPQLFTGPGDNGHAALFPAKSIAMERKDSFSPRDPHPQPLEPKVVGLPRLFPHFRHADRDFFKSHRWACHDDLMGVTGWTLRTARVLPVSVADPERTLLFKTRNRVTKPKERSTAAKPKTLKPPKPAPPTRTPARQSVKPRERASASLEPQGRKRAPPSKPITSDNWAEIDDFSPSPALLDNSPLRLRVHWKGVPNDLSADPEVGHLHPQEVEIAQELKLPASQYLSNKRRIFEARLKSIRERKNFTKTAAQQACNIDVNKTSQLFEAYEKVGWFDEMHFRHFLQ